MSGSKIINGLREAIDYTKSQNIGDYPMELQFDDDTGERAPIQDGEYQVQRENGAHVPMLFMNGVDVWVGDRGALADAQRQCREHYMVHKGFLK